MMGGGGEGQLIDVFSIKGYQFEYFCFFFLV